MEKQNEIISTPNNFTAECRQKLQLDWAIDSPEIDSEIMTNKQIHSVFWSISLLAIYFYLKNEVNLY